MDPTSRRCCPSSRFFLTYILSFIYTAIYWNNHHHMFLAVKEVNGAILWANSHLLFWLSVVPFVTAWASENHFAPIPTAPLRHRPLPSRCRIYDPPASNRRDAGAGFHSGRRRLAQT